MGYRQYFKAVDKEVVHTLITCNTEKDVYDTFKKYNFEANKNGNDNEDGVYYHCPPYNICGPEFEFGKYYENAEDLYKLGTPLFKGSLEERYCDYGIIFGGDELIQSAIKWQEEHIKEYYSTLINNTFSSEYTQIITEQKYTKNGVLDKEKMHYERLLEHCKEQMGMGWNRSFGSDSYLNMDKDNYILTESWLYELSLFNLISFYKHFDADKQYILFFGW